MRSDNSHKFFLKNGFKEGVQLDISANEETNIKKLIKLSLNQSIKLYNGKIPCLFNQFIID